MREEELRAYRNKAIEKDRRSIENRLNHAFNQGYEMGRQMAKDSSVEWVLDKIREEIKSKKFGLTDTEDGRRIQSDIHAAFDGGIECALQIIDKYKIEGKKGARNE